MSDEAAKSIVSKIVSQTVSQPAQKNILYFLQRRFSDIYKSTQIYQIYNIDAKR